MKIRNSVADFLPSARPLDSTRVAVNEAFKEKLAYVKIKQTDQFNPFMVLYITKALAKKRSFLAVKSYELVDTYLGKQEGESIWSYTQDIIVVIYGHSEVGNKIEINVLSQVIDVYKAHHQVLLVAHLNRSDVDLEDEKQKMKSARISAVVSKFRMKAFET